MLLWPDTTSDADAAKIRAARVMRVRRIAVLLTNINGI
jgi:hypothetical protein